MSSSRLAVSAYIIPIFHIDTVTLIFYSFSEYYESRV